MQKALLLSLIILFSVSSFCQWELYRKSVPNFYDYQRLIMADDTTGIILLDEEIYSTTNGGRIWNNVLSHSSTTDTLIASHFIGDFAMLIADNTPIFTTDGGRTWEENSPIPTLDFDRFQLLNDTQSYIYGYDNSGTPGYRLLQSTDRLTLMKPIPVPQGGNNPNDCFYFFDIDNGFYMIESGKTYYTEDQGLSWEERDSVPVTLMREVYFYDGNTGFAFGTGPGETFKTTDGGWTWQQHAIPGEAIINPVEMKYISANSSYLLTCRDLLFTSDGGVSWTALYSAQHDNLNSFSITGNEIFLSTGYVETIMGGPITLHSPDNGATWLAFTFPHTNGLDVEFINESTAFVCGGDGMAFNPYFLKTTDAFETLSLIKFPDSLYFGAFSTLSMANDSVGYIGLTDNAGYILKTNDGWQTAFKLELSDTIFAANANEIETFGDSLVFAKYDLQEYIISRDAGNTWSDLDNNWSMNGTDFFILDKNNFYNAGFFDYGNGNIDHSSDGGETWERWTVSDTTIFCVYFLDENTGWAGGANGTIVYTTDGGANWNESFVSQPHSNIHEIMFLNPNIGYAAGFESVYKTTDGGLTWGIQSMGDETGFQLIRFTDENTGYIFGREGLVMRTLNGGAPPLGTDEEPDPIPLEYVLQQNYPNPFNPATTIEYSIPEAAEISITVFNVLGEEVTQLVNGYHNPGSYKIQFDAGNLTSGVYFYRIKTNSYTATKKMLLLR